MGTPSWSQAFVFDRKNYHNNTLGLRNSVYDPDVALLYYGHEAHKAANSGKAHGTDLSMQLSHLTVDGHCGDKKFMYDSVRCSGAFDRVTFCTAVANFLAGEDADTNILVGMVWGARSTREFLIEKIKEYPGCQNIAIAGR